LEELKVAFLEAFRDIAAQQEADEKDQRTVAYLSETSAVPHCEHLPGILSNVTRAISIVRKTRFHEEKVQYKTIGGIEVTASWGHATSYPFLLGKCGLTRAVQGSCRALNQSTFSSIQKRMEDSPA